VAIAMALVARERAGVGQRIEVPLFDAMFAAIGGRAMIVHRPHAPQERPAGLWGGPFRCKDGRWVYFSATGNANFREFIEAAEITDWDAEGLTDRTRLAREPARRGTGRRIRALRDAPGQEWRIWSPAPACAVCRTSAGG
jgi:crotonobetainyl-CoA:carnitine CoA-transferase CaiB-like acyl-CoA transferase